MGDQEDAVMVDYSDAEPHTPESEAKARLLKERCQQWYDRGCREYSQLASSIGELESKGGCYSQASQKAADYIPTLNNSHQTREGQARLRLEELAKKVDQIKSKLDAVADQLEKYRETQTKTIEEAKQQQQRADHPDFRKYFAAKHEFHTEEAANYERALNSQMTVLSYELQMLQEEEKVLLNSIGKKAKCLAQTVELASKLSEAYQTAEREQQALLQIKKQHLASIRRLLQLCSDIGHLPPFELMQKEEHLSTEMYSIIEQIKGIKAREDEVQVRLDVLVQDTQGISQDVNSLAGVLGKPLPVQKKYPQDELERLKQEYRQNAEEYHKHQEANKVHLAELKKAHDQALILQRKVWSGAKKPEKHFWDKFRNKSDLLKFMEDFFSSTVYQMPPVSNDQRSMLSFFEGLQPIKAQRQDWESCGEYLRHVLEASAHSQWLQKDFPFIFRLYLLISTKAQDEDPERRIFEDLERRMFDALRSGVKFSTFPEETLSPLAQLMAEFSYQPHLTFEKKLLLLITATKISESSDVLDSMLGAFQDLGANDFTTMLNMRKNLTSRVVLSLLGCRKAGLEGDYKFLDTLRQLIELKKFSAEDIFNTIQLLSYRGPESKLVDWTVHVTKDFTAQQRRAVLAHVFDQVLSSAGLDKKLDDVFRAVLPLCPDNEALALLAETFCEGSLQGKYLFQGSGGNHTTKVLDQLPLDRLRLLIDRQVLERKYADSILLARDPDYFVLKFSEHAQKRLEQLHDQGYANEATVVEALASLLAVPKNLILSDHLSDKLAASISESIQKASKILQKFLSPYTLENLAHRERSLGRDANIPLFYFKVMESVAGCLGFPRNSRASEQERWLLHKDRERLLASCLGGACLVAILETIFREQKDFSFSSTQFNRLEQLSSSCVHPRALGLVEKIKSGADGIFCKFATDDFTEKDFLALSEKGWGRILELTENQGPSHAELGQKLRKGLAELQELKTACDWLYGILPNIEVPEIYGQTSLQHILDKVEEVRAALEDAIEDEEVTAQVAYFAGKSSKIFNAVFQECRRRKPIHDAGDFVIVWRQAYKRILETFASKQATMAAFTALESSSNLTEKERYPQISLISDYFIHHDSGSKVDVSLITKATQFRGYLSGIRIIFQVLEDQQMKCRESNECRRLFERFEELEGKQTYLRDIPDSLRQLQGLLMNLDVDHLDFFSKASDSKQLIVFFSQETEFQQHVELLTSQYQGQDFILGMLNDAQVAYKFLEIFFNKDATFKEVLEHVKKSTGEQKLDRLRAIETSSQNLNELRPKFAQVSEGTLGVIPRILDFMQAGRFSSPLSLTSQLPLGLECRNQAGRYVPLTDFEIDDMTRGITFCNVDNIEVDKKRVLDQFKICYQLALNIHRLRQQLQALGHPLYQDSTEKLQEDGVDHEFLKDHQKTLQDFLTLCEKDKDRALSEAPRLRLLDDNQLLSFMLAIRDTKRLQDDSLDWSPLLPYLCLLFPDSDEEQLRQGAEEVICKALQISKERLMKTIQEFTMQLVNDIQQALELDPSDLAGNAKGKAGLYDASRMSEEELENLLLCEIFADQHPLPFQLFDCRFRSEARMGDLQNFLQRASFFSSYRFAVVGITSLPSKQKEQLVKAILEEPLPSLLALVFTEEGAREMFSFVKHEVAELDADSFRRDFSSKAILTGSIKGLTLVKGEPGDGKSTFIHEQARAAARANPRTQGFVIPVNEDFSSEKIIRALGRLAPDTERGVMHLNLSSFCPFLLLNKALRDLVLSGYIIGETTGQVLRLPSTVEWAVFVEVPNGSDGDPLDSLPFAKVAGTDQKVGPETPFLLDHKARFVCAFFDKLEGALSKKCEQVEDDAKCAGILRDLFQRERRIVQVKFFQRAFIDHLCDRFRLLQRFYEVELQHQEDGLSSYTLTDKNFFKNMFNHLVQEATYFCNKSLRQDWSTLPQGFLAMGRDGLSANLLHLSCATEAEAKKKCPSPALTVLDGSMAVDHPDRLRADLAPALGVESSKMINIMEKGPGFVLTPDFALKLYVLNEKKKAGVPTTFQGDTGVGKSEILRVFSEILNASSGVMPDFSFEYACVLTKAITPVEGEAREKYQGLLEGFSLRGFARCENRLHFLFEKSLQIAEIAGADVDRIIKEILEFFEELFGAYPLLNVTEVLVERMGAWRDAARDQDQDARKVMEAFINDVVRPVSALSPVELFHKILMSESYTCEGFRAEMQRVIDANQRIRERLRRAGKEELADRIQIVLFIDELNTSSIPGVVKEIFVDRMMDGEPIPDNIFFVAAINPPRKKGQEDHDPQSDFVVRPLPPSMDVLILEFGSLTEAQERNFLKLFLDIRLPGEEDFSKRTQVLDLVLLSQKFVRDCKIFRVHPSFRDFVRVMDLYRFFSNGIFLADTTNIHWRALILALAVAYSFRMEARQEDEYVRRIQRALQTYQCPLQFEETVEESLQRLSSDEVMEIPKGIAKTRSLLINLFCTVVCVQARIPLLITGSPGRSKTLSFTIACDNMKGARAKFELFKRLKNIQRYHYQCSESSTSAEIQSVYLSALERKRRLEKAKITDEESVVFLDEGGLPDERKHALKVFHYYADHPQVSTVILSNTTLDAAKTNRCVQVLLPDADLSDHKILAEGLLFGKKPDESSFMALVEGSCAAFGEVNRLVDTRKNLFDLRDFVYYLRDLRRQLFARGNPVGLTSEMLYHAVARNFNGVSQKTFGEIVHLFFEQVNQCLDRRHLPKLAKPGAPPTLVTTVRESIEQHLVQEREDPNQASHRYVMLIDPTNADSSINALRLLNIPQNRGLKMVLVSDFPEDETEFVKGKQVSDIKSSMEKGETVLLINSGPIQTNFYELFNRYFVSVTGNDGEKKYFANVAVGSYSRPCTVHPHFQIIIVIPLEEFKRAPAPFLNRFEKYVLSLKDAFFDHPRKAQVPIMEELVDGVRDFVKQCSPASFYGLVDEETLYSLMLVILNRSSNGIPVIPEAPTASEAGEIDDEGLTDEPEDRDIRRLLDHLGAGGALPTGPDAAGPQFDSADYLRGFIRRSNLFLMQIARPESIFGLRGRLPREYIIEYLMKQEHFSFLSFFGRLQEFIFGRGEVPAKLGRKWIVYTRTTGEIFQIPADPQIQDLLLAPLLKLRGAEENAARFAGFMSLSNMGSAEQCEAAIKSFYASGRSVLLCTADMSKASRLQVNMAKKAVDDCEAALPIEQRETRLVVVLLHFPASQLSACYSTVFASGWNYNYVDSFGAQHLFGLMEEEGSSKLVKSPDIRKWIRVAFGLDQGLDLRDFAVEFKDRVLSSLNAIAENPTYIFKNPASIMRFQGQLRITREGYTKRGEFKRLLKVVFEKEHFLKALLGAFSKCWNGQEIRELFSAIISSIAKGETTLPICDLVRMAMDDLIKVLVQKTTVALTSNYGLEAYLGMEGNPPAGFHDYIFAVLQTVEIPKPGEVIGSSQVKVARVVTDSPPVRLPLSNLIIGELTQRLDQIRSKKGTFEFSIHEAVKTLEKSLATLDSQDRFRKTIDLVHKNKSLADLMRRDMLLTLTKLKFEECNEVAQNIICKWLDLASPDPTKLTGILVLTDAALQSQFQLLLWTLAELALFPPDSLPLPAFFDECHSPEAIQGATLQYFFKALHSLTIDVASNPSAEKAEALCSLLSKTFTKFETFQQLWDHLMAVSRPSEEQMVEIQSEIIFQALLYHLVTSLALEPGEVDWAKVGKARQDCGAEFRGQHQQGRAGFSVTAAVLEKFQAALLQEHAENSKLCMFAVLATEFFLLGDLPRPARPQRQGARLGCCLHNGQASADLVAFFDLLQSRGTLARHFSPFTLVSLLQRLLANDNLGPEAEKALEAFFSSNELAKEEVGKFQPLELQDQPAPQQEGNLVSSAFSVLLHKLSSGTSPEELIRIYDLQREANNGEGYPKLRLMAAKLAMVAQASRQLSEINNLQEGFEGWRNERLCNMVAEMLRGDVGLQRYLLGSLHPSERQGEVMKSDAVRRQLHLDPQFHLLDTDNVLVDHLFPFALGKDQVYEGLKAALAKQAQAGAQEALAMIRAACQGDARKGPLLMRMYLASVAYVSHFSEGRPCAALQQLLGQPEALQLLQIEQPEVRALVLLASGPKPNVNELDAVESLFHRKPATPEEGTMRNLLANILIFTLGTPAGSNHLHMRVFDPPKLVGNVRGPGGTFPSNDDCGYVMDERGNLTDHPCFRRSRPYRLAMNTATWGALALALLVDPNDANVRVIGDRCLHGGYPGDESVQHLRNQDRSIILKKYVLDRPLFFCFWLGQEKTLGDHGLSPLFFVTQALHRLWGEILRTMGTPEGAPLKAVYQSEQETNAYEEFITVKVLDAVLGERQALKRPYEEAVEKSKAFARLQEHSAKYREALKASVRVLYRDHFEQTYSLVSQEFPLVQQLLELKKFKDIKHLPLLVRAHNWVHTRFAGILTAAEAMEVSFLDALKRLPQQADRREGEQIFRELQKIWAGLSDYNVCRYAQEAGEAAVPQLDDHAKLLTLACVTKDSMESDHLMKQIEDLSKRQNERAEGAASYEVRNLLHDKYPSAVLLTIPDGESETDWVFYFAKLEDGQLSFDWDSIQRKLQVQYFNGLPPLEFGGLRTELEFFDEDEVTPDDGKDAAPAKEAQAQPKAPPRRHMDPLSMVALLHRILSKVDNELKGESGLEKAWDTQIKKLEEADVVAILRFLKEVCLLVAKGTQGVDPEGSLEDFARDMLHLPQSAQTFITSLKLKMCHLGHFSRFTMRLYQEQRFLFRKVPRELDAVQLSEEMVAELRQLPRLGQEHGLLEKLPATIKKLAEEVQANFKNLQKLSQKPLAEVLPEGLLQGLELPEPILRALLPKGLACSQTGPYLRQLAGMSRLLEFMHSQEQDKSNSQAQDRGVYVELVPKAFEKFQKKLANSEVLAMGNNDLVYAESEELDLERKEAASWSLPKDQHEEDSEEETEQQGEELGGEEAPRADEPQEHRPIPLEFDLDDPMSALGEAHTNTEAVAIPTLSVFVPNPTQAGTFQPHQDLPPPPPSPQDTFPRSPRDRAPSRSDFIEIPLDFLDDLAQEPAPATPPSAFLSPNPDITPNRRTTPASVPVTPSASAPVTPSASTPAHTPTERRDLSSSLLTGSTQSNSAEGNLSKMCARRIIELNRTKKITPEAFKQLSGLVKTKDAHLLRCFELDPEGERFAVLALNSDARDWVELLAGAREKGLMSEEQYTTLRLRTLQSIERVLEAAGMHDLADISPDDVEELVKNS